MLVDLEVLDADRAPERRIALLAIENLLVSFMGFLVFGARHEGSTEQVPALRVKRTC